MFSLYKGKLIEFLVYVFVPSFIKLKDFRFARFSVNDRLDEAETAA